MLSLGRNLPHGVRGRGRRPPIGHSRALGHQGLVDTNLAVLCTFYPGSYSLFSPILKGLSHDKLGASWHTLFDGSFLEQFFLLKGYFTNSSTHIIGELPINYNV